MAISATMVAQRPGWRGERQLHREQAVCDGLIVAPAQTLGAHRAAIMALAEHGQMPNPFFLPAFLEPALAAFGHERVHLALLYDHGELVFFAPVVAPPVAGPLFGALKVWTHEFAPLGTPLMPRKRARDVAALLATSLRRTGIGTFIIPDAPLGVLEVAAIRKAIVRNGGGEVMARSLDRPILAAAECRDTAAADAAVASLVSAKRRKEMGRQLRRLGDIGPVRFRTFDAPADVKKALAAFLALEAAGWKGRAGTALLNQPRLDRFARDAVIGLSTAGLAQIDVLTVGNRLAAAMTSFRCQGQAVPWKIAFAESLAAGSPGSQLMLAATRAWLADPAVRRVDPVCGSDHPMLRHFWRDTDRYATLILGTGGRGVAQQLFGVTDRVSDRSRRVAGRVRASVRSGRRR